MPCYFFLFGLDNFKGCEGIYLEALLTSWALMRLKSFFTWRSGPLQELKMIMAAIPMSILKYFMFIFL